jgi:predicted exporter
VLVVAVLPVPILLWVGGPPVSEVLVALRPADLVPLAVQRDIQERFGGGGGQWVVLSVDKDPEQARTRADRVTEALDPLAVRGVVVDALTTFAPSRTTQAERLRVRDKLDLPSLRPRLAEALEAEGFDLEACAPSLEAFTHPSQELHDSTGQDFVTARHLAQDSGETLVATYVRLPRDAQGEVLAAIGQGDANAMVTGYPFLERGLRRTLARDLPRVGLAALGAALVTLALGLRSVRGVVLAFVVLAVELLWVTMVMRVCGLSWHLYSALVLPVLVGITLDEVMFLLVGANRDKDVLVKQGPLVATTALTTAAGFGALMVCRFDGLREPGAVGALGAVLGLVAALAVVAAGLRVFDS